MKKLIIFVVVACVFLWITALVSSSSICSGTNFSAARSFKAGLNCCGNDLEDIATGDLNNDGRPDIVTASGLSNSISILLSDGHSYLPAGDFPVAGSRPFSVAIGDLNNDGKADVVTVNVISHNLSLLLGNGAGGFGAATLLNAGSDPVAITIADFNSDGNLDLAVGDNASATVNVLLGDGMGAFGSFTSFGVGITPWALASADLDLDGNLDLVVANRGSNNVSVLIGDGAGGFAAAETFSVGSNPEFLAIADFNGDGKKDLAVANFGSFNVSVLVGVGDGSFGPASNLSVGVPVNSVVVGDFNNDGNTDLAAGSSTAGIFVWLGEGTGNFGTARTVLPGSGPLLLVISDFNLDGSDDIVAASAQASTIIPLPGDGAGNFITTPSQTTGSNVISTVLVDINNDGNLDAVLANENTNSVSVRLGTGTDTFGTATTFSVGMRPFWVSSGDFNSDGNVDLVTANFLEGLSVLFGDGSGSFGPAVSISLGSPPFNPLFVGVSDINNDGKLDLLAIRQNVHAVTVLLGDGAGGFGSPVNITTASNPQALAVADFNGDGKADLAVTDNSFSILLGDGAGGFGDPITTNFGDNTGVGDIVASDFNGDGKWDVAIANKFTNDVSVLIGDGTGNFAPRVNFKVGLQPFSVKVGDFDGDGFSDLVAGNFTSQSVTVLLGNGAGSFGSATDWSVPASVNSVAIGDIDSDGRTDITAVGSNVLAVLLNTCDEVAILPDARLSVDDVTVTEGDSGFVNAVFTVNLEPASAQTVTTKFYTSGVDARRGVDFEEVSGMLTFAPGVTSQTIVVAIIGDTTDEFNEKFSVNLYEPVNALINDRQGLGTINDNDPEPSLSIHNASAMEGDINNLFSVPVTLSQVSGKLITVAYATASGTATAGSDFSSASGTLKIPAETSSTAIRIEVIGDTVDEPDETFFVSLTNPVNASISTAQSTVTIVNDDTPFVQFSSSSFNALEGTELTINVVRSGDTSGEAFVSYATTDNTATERRDYTAAIGRLGFGPGETSKTLRILITDDAYDDDDESFDVALNDPLGITLGAVSTATISIIDNDAADGPSPVRDTSLNIEFFVRQHYADFLNRSPDADGLAFWMDQVTGCGNPDLLVCRINVSAAFFLSIEFQETGYLVYRIHKSAFGNIASTPVPVRLRPFIADTRQIGDGVQVGIANWEEQLEANKVAFLNEFVSRSEFSDLYDDLTNEQYVDSLNTNAEGALTSIERDALVNALDEGTMTRAQVLRAVADDQTLKDAEFNKAFVLFQYFGYLRRDPDESPDTGFEGYDFWLGKLNQFGGNFINAEMVKAFIQSFEYSDRFGL